VIPSRLRFSGIRDYGPTEMNLDTANEHVLITGPNGAGKSTLSFCMGAVLRSSKVDISGLKSQNLPEDQTWRASIHFLFKNEGPSRIDGPLYIEFRLLCEQQPSQPIKLHYEIHDGDALDGLELRQKYRSGDVNKNNFTAYQRALQFKYKIHPDLYYLIWYQQEVNQFAVMAPEERFRIFSEMHGIDKIQKDWEISLEVVKEAQESLATATTQQKSYEFELGIARNKKDRYEDNQRRLTDSGFEYALTTHALHTQSESNLKEMTAYIEDRVFELEDLTDEKHDMMAILEVSRHEQNMQHQQKEESQAELERLTEHLDDKDKNVSEKESQVETLATELSDLTEAYQQLPYPEAETKEKLHHAQDQVTHFNEKEIEQQEKIDAANETIERNREEQSNIKAAIHQWEEKSKTAYELMTRYTSSHQLTTDMAELQSRKASLQKQYDEKAKELHIYEEKLAMLQGNQIESSRQQEAIQHLKEQGIQAYAFRDFVRLQDHLDIEKEQRFDAIKYTIFYDASTCEPKNDLYHVSLKGLVPNRSITELPGLGLRMCKGLTSSEQNQAARILWWVEQFFTTESPRIKNSHVIDQQGVRGSQEQDTYILSEKAVKQQIKTIQQQIHVLAQQVKTLNEKWHKENDKYQIWNADVQKVKEAEAFLTSKGEQKYRQNKLRTLESDFKQLQQDKEQYEQTAKAYWEKAYHWKEAVRKRQEDLAVYEQFGQQANKIDHLHKLEISLTQEKKEMQTIKGMIKRTHDVLDELEQTLRINNRHIAELEDDIEQNKRTKAQILKQKDEKEAERMAMVNQVEKYKMELNDLKNLIPQLVEQALDEERIENSKYELQNRQNQAKVEFMTARSEKDIDPNAVENFNTLEAEVEQKKDELLAAKNLLEENEERASQNEQRLETAIAMQVQKINLLFEQYMGMFQFEGRVVYEKWMNKKDRPIFKLFIHVRKEGHRGKLEDVSLKARGGRVGKGVSGGEESLSSLLFALSLLQNLENKSSFIVMDEFDSALDESRKAKVFELYANELQRKLIILSPKGHEDDYYERFSKAFIVSHNPIELKSTVKGLMMKNDEVNI